MTNDIYKIKNHTYRIEKKDIQRRRKRNDDLIFSEGNTTQKKYNLIEHNITFDGYFVLNPEDMATLLHTHNIEANDFCLYDFIEFDVDKDLNLIARIPYQVMDKITFSINRNGDLTYTKI